MIRKTAVATANAATASVAIDVPLRWTVMPNPKNRREVQDTKIIMNGHDIEFEICSEVKSRWSAIDAAISFALECRNLSASVVGLSESSDVARASMAALLSTTVGGVALPCPQSSS